jgi:hypothetical protein
VAFHLFNILPAGLGTLAFLGSLAGLAIMIFRGGIWRLLAFFTLLMFFLFSSNPNHFERYMIPILPFLALSLGVFFSTCIEQLVKYLPDRKRILTPAFFVLAWAVFFSGPVLTNMAEAKRSLAVDTRSEAFIWIHHNLTPNALIATEAYCPTLMPSINKIKDATAGGCPGCSRALQEVSLDPNYRGFYTADLKMRGIGTYSPADYYDRFKVHYICYNSLLTGRKVFDPEWGETIRNSIEGLNRYYDIVKKFVPGEGGGPEITILRRKPNPEAAGP